MKYKIGDRVIVSGEVDDDFDFSGQLWIGEVYSILSEGEPPIGIRFDEYNPRFHDLVLTGNANWKCIDGSKTCEDFYGFFVYADNLMKDTPQNREIVEQILVEEAI